MSHLKERIAYLRGLAEGLDINEDTKDGKIVVAIIDTLDMICAAMDTMDYVEETNFICPNCNEQIDIDDGMFESQERIICPNCKEPMNIITHDF